MSPLDTSALGLVAMALACTAALLVLSRLRRRKVPPTPAAAPDVAP